MFDVKEYSIRCLENCSRAEFGKKVNYKRKKLLDKTAIYNFETTLIDKYGIHSVGKNLVWDCVTWIYFIYFYKKNDGFIIPSRLYSKSKIDNYILRSSESAYLKDKWIEELGLVKPEFEIEQEESNTNNLDVVERIKGRFFNEDRGFITCLENFIFFDSSSRYCTNCSFRKDCKILMETNKNDR